MPTITGRLEAAINIAPEIGTVDVQLCGYGSQVPCFVGTALVARITCAGVPVEDDGSFTFGVPGNDEIAPAGTYYTVTIRDSNGDIAQVNAYQFLSDPDSYDLNTIKPFDPSQALPPMLPPLIRDLLLEVPYDPDAVFPGNEYTAWSIELTGDCTPVFNNLLDGNLYTIIILQADSIGHAFNWPGNVSNATAVCPDPVSLTIQTFVALNDGLFAISAATYYDLP